MSQSADILAIKEQQRHIRAARRQADKSKEEQELHDAASGESAC